MKRALLIYNPVSGAKGWKDVPRILISELEDQGWEWDWFETVKGPVQPLEPFLDTAYDRIVVAGGDGTVAMVAEFMIRHGLKTPLVIIPQGSANLLAATLMLPLFQVKKALRLGLTQAPQALDVMRVNGNKIALIAAGRGYDAFLMKETTRALKRHWGFFAYGMVMFRTFFLYRRQPYKLTIDGERVHVSSKAVVVFNAFPLAYFKASQLLLGKRIIPSDGVLNVFTMGKFWKITPYKGKQIVIKTKEARSYQMDGEVFSCRTLHIEVLPKALQVVHTNRF